MSVDGRPDPDALLARVQAAEWKASRGKLKIFFGASAGVGKTYAMLNAARRQQETGSRVLIGVVETHGRKETQALLADLERLPLCAIPYRDQMLHEFDLDAALERHPDLILMDELAHSNVAGSRHPKRWQDVNELLDAGIDVYTTVNVQHLETLNDVVSGITGIRVWETVPDHVFDAADEVVLVDLPPDELLQRLKDGKVYLPQQAERAIRNFFRKGNLMALRELALRRTADRVDDEMLAYRREISADAVWHTREALLVCIGSGPGSERIVRTGARMAGRLEAPWHVIHIETADVTHERVVRAFELAESLGAKTMTLQAPDPVAALVDFAREHNLARVLLGRDHPRPWWRPWYRSFADRIGHAAPDLDVIQAARDEEARGAGNATQSAIEPPDDWRPYLEAVVMCAVTTVLLTPFADVFEITNIAMLFLLGVVVVAVKLGRGPALAAAFLAVAAFDYFFVPPRWSFVVSDVRFLTTFVVMLLVALIVGQLTARYKHNAEVAIRRERRARALYEMARNLSAVLLPMQVEEVCSRFLSAEFGAQTVLLLANLEDKLEVCMANRHSGSMGAEMVDEGVARWAFDHGDAAGLGTDTLPGSQMLYLPLKASMRTRGVLAIAPRDPLVIREPEARRQLETFASLVAIAVERMHYVEVAQNSLLQMESESLRNSLLAAISHDLRTPLAVLVGLAESMALTQPAPTGAQVKIATAMKEEAVRMSAQVNNLLDMARLQAGKVELNRQWQPLEEVVAGALQASGHILAGHVVQVHLPEDLPLLELDTVLIERVLCNLLENAAKYTPPGTQVEITALAKERDVEIRVADRGPGLAAGREDAIFQKFERGERESSKPGVGLGLAICRAIVEAHGGVIRAENRAGGGACFIFTLPRGTPPDVAAEMVVSGEDV